jgi:hypothetical protein
MTDKSGVLWEIYEVPAPRLRDARSSELSERKTPDGVDIGARLRSPVNNRLASGWLCFESESERRRIGPAPENWGKLSDAELQALLDSAVPAPEISAAKRPQ